MERHKKTVTLKKTLADVGLMLLVNGNTRQNVMQTKGFEEDLLFGSVSLHTK